MSAPGDGPSAPEVASPPPPSGPQWEIVAAVVVVLVAGAVAVGAIAAVRGRSAPTPVPVVAAITTPVPTPTPTDPAEMQRRAFAQPLVAGCATDRAVWLFADGGAVIRFDGSEWSIPDPTLRSLSAAACGPASALAVGAAGSILRIDDERRLVLVDRSGIEDLHAVALLPDGALAVGTRGTLLRQTAADWIPIDAGIPVDLYGVAVKGSSGWLVGERGAVYRIDGSATRTSASGTTVALRTVVIPSAGAAIAAGDDGTLLRWAGSSWVRVTANASGPLRAAVVSGQTAWVVGDAGTVLVVQGDEIRRVDLATTCTLRAAFSQGSLVWIVGSDGLAGSAWRIAPSGTDKWGSC